MAGVRGLSWRTWRLRVENCQRNLFTHGFAGQLGSSNPSLWPFHIVPLCGLVLASSWHGDWVQKARRDTLLIMVSLKKVLDHALDAFYSTWWSQSPVSRRVETDSACLWEGSSRTNGPTNFVVAIFGKYSLPWSLSMLQRRKVDRF